MALFELDGHRVKTPASGRFWVAPNAVVIGRVELEEESSVWFNCVLRGDNEPIRIGAGSNVQENSVLHTDPGFPMTIGPGVTIGHLCMLHGCSIGRGSLIGMGSIVLNGAKIGEDCLIGAHTLIPEGKEIPARSLVMGSPGKIMREISEANLALMRMSSDYYVDNWKRFAAGLKPQG